MKEQQELNFTTNYLLVKKDAERYFQKLLHIVQEQNHYSTLIKNLQAIKLNSLQQKMFLSKFSHSSSHLQTKDDFSKYIRRLNQMRKLDDYVDRSVSYIFLRDIGQDIQSDEIKEKIDRTVQNYKKYLLDFASKDDSNLFTMSELYKLAKQYQLETTFIWLNDKLSMVYERIPNGIDKEKAMVKLIKIITGVVMNQWINVKKDLDQKELSEKLDQALRLGYAYGITYPFIDDLLDSQILPMNEERKFTTMIRFTLTTGSVPPLGEWQGEYYGLIKFIHMELKQAFEYIKSQQLSQNLKNQFLQDAYIFFLAQEDDRLKNLQQETISNKDLYIPVIIKSAYSRVMVHSITNRKTDKRALDNAFYFGVFNQLSDDFRDFYLDLEKGAVTPFTYYYTHYKKRKDLVNPLEMYWAVIDYLINKVFSSDQKITEVILSRVIEFLNRLKEIFGDKKYQQLMKVFSFKNSKFTKQIEKIIKSNQIDFLDRLLSDELYKQFRQMKINKEVFEKRTKAIQMHINDFIKLDDGSTKSTLETPIIEAANYSLMNGGKRLRPILTWLLGEDVYNIDSQAIKQMVKALEMMHTASLIYDDLPSQDNAVLRRGRPTLHEVYNVATAELTALFMTQKAIYEQSFIEKYNPKSILKLIQYSTAMACEMCKGQLMDLTSRGKLLTLEELRTISHFKTGIGFEVPLVMPAILADVKENEILTLKKFAYHLGIAFQIKDDLLDIEGELIKLGKEPQIDISNNQSTFVTILGIEGAKKALWGEYCEAMDSLDKLNYNTSFLREILHYVVNRDY